MGAQPCPSQFGRRVATHGNQKQCGHASSSTTKSSYIHQLYELVNLKVFVPLAGGGRALPTRRSRYGFYLRFRVEITVYWKHYLLLLQNV